MGKEAKDIVRLTDEARHILQQLVVGLRVARDKALRAQMLLKAGLDDPHWSDGQIADAFEVGMSTIHRWRQRLVEAGLDAALTRHPPAPSHANSTGRKKRVSWPWRAAACRERDIQVMAEEMRLDGLFGAKQSVCNQVADALRLTHRYCDPSIEEQKTLGIVHPGKTNPSAFSAVPDPHEVDPDVEAATT